MKKIVELPLIPPVYSTYHNQGTGTAILTENPSIRNWYLNQVLILNCSRKFLHGFTTPEIKILDSVWEDNPYLDKQWYPMRFLNGYVHYVIRNLLDAGYYVFFGGIDDYYIEGKSWYSKRHFTHDGCICGYNQEDKSYCIYAYDQNWVYRKFWTPQKSFERGRKAMFRKAYYEKICGIKPSKTQVSFFPTIALKKIEEYLDSSMERYPVDEDGLVYGIVVQDYIAQYVDKLYDGSISYERMDRRIFRLIWEHKKVMLERIQRIEQANSRDSKISSQYEPLVAEANCMRMLYAAHAMKRRDSVLPVIKEKLLRLKEREQMLLTELLRTS